MGDAGDCDLTAESCELLCFDDIGFQPAQYCSLPYLTFYGSREKQVLAPGIVFRNSNVNEETVENLTVAAALAH